MLVHVSAAWRRQRPGCCAAVPHLLELCEPLRVSCTRPDGGEGGQVLRSCTDGLHNGLQGAWQSLAQLTGGVHTSKVLKGGCMASSNHTGGTGAGEHVASGGCGGVSRLPTIGVWQKQGTNQHPRLGPVHLETTFSVSRDGTTLKDVAVRRYGSYIASDCTLSHVRNNAGSIMMAVFFSAAHNCALLL